MKKIVITGSSKGIGYGLAKYFLEEGHKVVIVGSTEKSTMSAYNKFVKTFPTSVYKVPCDVTDYAQVVNLGHKAAALMGGIDIWINNAGISQPAIPTHLLSEEQIRKIVDVNIHGVINGSKFAMNYFIKKRGGALYNMEGLGSDGRIAANVGYYGSSKRFVRYYTRVLAKENKNKNIIVARLSPGMVTTDLLLKDIEKSKNKEKTLKIFNILADKVEDVAPFLGKRILSNRKNDALIAWLTTPKIVFRFLTAGFIKRNPLG